MGSVIKTKFNGSLNDDSLRTIDEIEIDVINADIAALSIIASSAFSARCTGDCYFTNQDGDNLGKTYQSGSAGSVNAIRVSGTGKLFIEARYGQMGYVRIANVQSLHLSMDISNFCYMKDSGDITLSLYEPSNGYSATVYGDVSRLQSTLGALHLKGAGLYGDMSEMIADSSSLYQLFLDCVNVSYNTSCLVGKSGLRVDRVPGKAYGDFANFAETQSATHSSGMIFSASEQGITGSIEGFVERAITLGKTGTVTLNFVGIEQNSLPNVTYNGNPLSDLFIDSTKVHVKFTWDAQGNISYVLV